MAQLSKMPSRLDGPMAWDGFTYKDKPELYTYTLSQEDIVEIKKALAHFKSLELSRGHVTRDTFPLSQHLSQLLAQVNDTLNNGRGFQVIRGIDPASFSEEDHVLLFAGIASHIASHRAGWMDHIHHAKKDEESGATDLRPNELPIQMDFHTDSDCGNVLSLFTISKAQTGGEQFLSSFWRIYNYLAEEAPETLTELAADWYWEKQERAATPVKAPVASSRALMGIVDGKAEINYGRSFVAGHIRYPLSSGAPTLTEAQENALSTLRDVAQKHSFQLETKAGDILFINNLSIMHGRAAYQDGANAQTARHVLRLFLKDVNSWPTAPSLKYLDDAEMWNSPPEEQSLFTVSEWAEMPRFVRVTETRNSLAQSHD